MRVYSIYLAHWNAGTVAQFEAGANTRVHGVLSIYHNGRQLTVHSMDRYHRPIPRTIMKYAAAALLALLMLSWIGPAFGAGVVAGAGLALE